MNPAPASQPAPQRPTVPKKKKSNRKWYIIGAVVLVIALSVAAKLSNRGKDNLTAVTTDKAVIRTITQVVTATGKIQPEVEVKISPEVAGEIIAMPVKEGSIVKKATCC
jgi:HlyD family secretion protein